MINGLDNDKVVSTEYFVNDDSTRVDTSKLNLWYPFGLVFPLDWDYLDVIDVLEQGTLEGRISGTITHALGIINADGNFYTVKLNKRGLIKRKYPTGRGIVKVVAPYTDNIVSVNMLMDDHRKLKCAIETYLKHTHRDDTIKVKEFSIAKVVEQLKAKGLTQPINELKWSEK